MTRSAMPIAYWGVAKNKWERFGRLILEAAYEATFCAAVLNAQEHGDHRLFLTLLGGGAFGNPFDCIFDSLQRSIELFPDRELDVVIVSHGGPHPHLAPLLD